MVNSHEDNLVVAPFLSNASLNLIDTNFQMLATGGNLKPMVKGMKEH